MCPVTPRHNEGDRGERDSERSPGGQGNWSDNGLKTTKRFSIFFVNDVQGSGGFNWIHQKITNPTKLGYKH